MNEWFKKTFETIKEKWTKWTAVQKSIGVGIVVVVIAAIVLLITLSSRQTSVRLFNAPVTDDTRQGQILDYLSENHVNAFVSADGYIYVDNEDIAKKYQSRLIVEGLAPTSIDPYSLWKSDKWSIDDFQQNKVNWKQTIERQVTQRLESLPAIRKANVTLVLPDESIFASTQKPTTASITLYAAYGSDILESKSSIRGIQNIIKYSVEGLTDEYITIFNGDTNEEINNFEGMKDIEQVDITRRQQQLIAKLETEYSNSILELLVGTYGRNRVNIARMKIDMDQSKKTVSSKEYSGITIKSDNPDTAYDDSEILTNLEISKETVEKTWTGTGYNPEGPAGVEGQNPPVYSDSSNLIGKSVEKGEKVNNALNETNTYREVAPQIDRLTIAVNIDGVWRKVYKNGAISFDPDTGIERVYTPISDEDLVRITQLVRAAVGYDEKRGDSVVVTNLAFDHNDEFEAENEAYRKKMATRKTIILVLIGVAVILVGFILFRIISRYFERKRRLREEELLRKQQAEREQALWDANQQGMEVTMSVEERKRAELQENAIAMAKEHPEDVAMLIRTWLMEE